MKQIIIYTFFLILPLVLHAQTDEFFENNSTQMNLKNSEGREFWLCFMKNFKDDDRRQSKSNDLLLELFITGDKDANVKIEVRGIGYSETIFVPGGTVKSIKIDQLAQVRSFEIIEQQQAVHIVSDNPISVYGLNRRFQTTDTYLGLPLEVLGTEYRVMSYFITDDLLSIFAIVATDNNTVIEITPTVDTYSGKKANEMFKVTLNKGDVYQVAGIRNPASRLKSDLTGSHIKSNKPISVFGGHQCAYVPSVIPEIIACNHLAEQIPPIHSWGRHFYIGKMKLRSKYTYRVLAHYPNTKLFENSDLVQVLKPGEFFEKQSDKDIQITADKPVLVAQYSQGFKNGDSIGDPMMLLISPTQQFLRKYRFATPINGEWEHIINIVVPTNSINTMQLNGMPIDTNEFSPLGISRYSIAYLTIPFGTHVIEGAMPFGMYSYGFGRGFDAFDAYGSMGGQSFIEYEPAKDVNAPTAEYRKTAKHSVIFRDDGRDDTGIKDIIVIENNNIDFRTPVIIESTPQYVFDIAPRIDGLDGRMVVQVRDMALNTSVFTICYLFDQYENEFRFVLGEGDDVNCTADYGYTVGFFGKLNFNFHHADFSKTGNIAAPGTFSDGSGNSGYFGFLFAKNFDNRWSVSARLSLESYSGTISAPDSTVSRVRDVTTGELKNFQEQRNLEATGYFTQLFIGGEYRINNFFYSFAGLSLSVNLSNSARFDKTIVEPTDFVYSNGRRRITPDDAPNSINSMYSLRFGAFAGIGICYPVYKRYSAFLETTYNHPLMDLVNDANWKFSQFSILCGIKYRI